MGSCFDKHCLLDDLPSDIKNLIMYFSCPRSLHPLRELGWIKSQEFHKRTYEIVMHLMKDKFHGEIKFDSKVDYYQLYMFLFEVNSEFLTEYNVHLLDEDKPRFIIGLAILRIIYCSIKTEYLKEYVSWTGKALCLVGEATRRWDKRHWEMNQFLEFFSASILSKDDSFLPIRQLIWNLSDSMKLSKSEPISDDFP